MSERNLEYFIKVFEKDNDLLRIREYVNPVLEVTEITERISKLDGGGKAILFENSGTDFPVAINIFGSLKRICEILNVKHLNEIGKEIDVIFKSFSKPQKGILSKIKLLPKLKHLANWLPSEIGGKGLCQEIIHLDPDLSILPVLKCWPNDGGRFITLPMVITKDPETRLRNVGMYRMQILGKNETAMHWQKYKTGRMHFEKYKNLNQKMPVAVAIGGDPIYTYSATAPLPEGVDEFLFAGFLRKKKVKMVKCITQNIEVPFDADIILEGYIDPSEKFVWEGPFGDHTGFYSLADWFPKFHVTCITHKRNAIYTATIVGPPPMEDAWMAKATERIFLSPMKLAISPEIIDMLLPFEGVAHNIAIIKIKNSFYGQATRVMHALWGAGQMAFNKILFVVNDDIDLSDSLKLAKLLSEKIDVKNDIHISEGVLDELDHASESVCYGGKICFDLTNSSKESVKIDFNNCLKWKEDLINQKSEISNINIDLLKEDISVVIIGINKTENIKDLINEVIIKKRDLNLKIMIFVEDCVNIRNYSTLAWIVSGNIDPKRDCIIHSESKVLTIDATRKIFKGDKHNREWPNIVVMDNDTINRINNSWKCFGINKFIDSPSLSRFELNNQEGVIAKMINIE